MAVDVQGHRGVGVPQPLRHDLNGLPRSDQQRRAGVPHGVGAGPRKVLPTPHASPGGWRAARVPTPARSSSCNGSSARISCQTGEVQNSAAPGAAAPPARPPTGSDQRGGHRRRRGRAPGPPAGRSPVRTTGPAPGHPGRGAGAGAAWARIPIPGDGEVLRSRSAGGDDASQHAAQRNVVEFGGEAGCLSLGAEESHVLVSVCGGRRQPVRRTGPAGPGPGPRCPRGATAPPRTTPGVRAVRAPPRCRRRPAR